MKKSKILTVILLMAILIISGCSSEPWDPNQGNPQQGNPQQGKKQGHQDLGTRKYFANPDSPYSDEGTVVLEFQTDYVIEGILSFRIDDIKRSETDYNGNKAEGMENVIITGKVKNLQDTPMYPGAMLTTLAYFNRIQSGARAGWMYTKGDQGFSAVVPLPPQEETDFVINIQIEDYRMIPSSSIDINLHNIKDKDGILYWYKFQ